MDFWGGVAGLYLQRTLHKKTRSWQSLTAKQALLSAWMFLLNFFPLDFNVYMSNLYTLGLEIRLECSL